jgi:hypothetical protein
VTVGPSIREMAAEEARRRAMNDEPHEGDYRAWQQDDHPSVLTSSSPDFLTASAEFTAMWDEDVSHRDFPERI